MSIGASTAAIVAAHSRARHQWQATRSVWRDEVAASFERHYWAPVDAHWQTLNMAAERLESTLDAALSQTRDP